MFASGTRTITHHQRASSKACSHSFLNLGGKASMPVHYPQAWVLEFVQDCLEISIEHPR